MTACVGCNRRAAVHPGGLCRPCGRSAAALADLLRDHAAYGPDALALGIVARFEVTDRIPADLGYPFEPDYSDAAAIERRATPGRRAGAR